MGESLGGAAKLHLPANVVAAQLAELAAAAGLADLEGDVITYGKGRYRRPDGGHHAGGLVAQCKWLLNQDVPIPVVVEVV